MGLRTKKSNVSLCFECSWLAASKIFNKKFSYRPSRKLAACQFGEHKRQVYREVQGKTKMKSNSPHGSKSRHKIKNKYKIKQKRSVHEMGQFR